MPFAAGPRRALSRLAENLAGRLLFRRVPLQAQLVELMRRETRTLGGATADVIDLWQGLRGQLRERLSRDDPAEFLRWPPVRQTMVRRGHRRVRPELAHLRARPDWRRRWRSAVRETTLGGPRLLPRCPWSSANLISQAYHLCRFEEATGRSLATMRTIVEFGGGYGRLCHLVHDLGFSGTYVIFDLPEVAVLQRFYLRHVGIAVSEARGAAWPPARRFSNIAGRRPSSNRSNHRRPRPLRNPRMSGPERCRGTPSGIASRCTSGYRC